MSGMITFHSKSLQQEMHRGVYSRCNSLISSDHIHNRKNTAFDLLSGSRMKPPSRLLGFVALTLSLSFVSALADTFDYSYTFENGFLATGSFRGTQNGNLVNNVTDVTLFFNGSQTPGPVVAGSGDVLSFDITLNTLNFTGSGFYFNMFYFVPPPVPGEPVSSQRPAVEIAVLAIPHNPLDPSPAGTEDFSAAQARWFLTNTTPQDGGNTVPDTASTFSLLGLSMIGLVTLRRKFAKN